MNGNQNLKTLLEKLLCFLVLGQVLGSENLIWDKFAFWICLVPQHLGARDISGIFPILHTFLNLNYVFLVE